MLVLPLSQPWSSTPLGLYGHSGDSIDSRIAGSVVPLGDVSFVPPTSDWKRHIILGVY